MLASANLQAEARAQQFAALIESHHELLSNLQQQALPVTASALEMGLQQGLALRDGLLAASVRDATKKAEVIFGANLEGATEAQTRIEAENLDQMRAAIEALGKAQALIADRTDQAIEHGLASLELVEKVTASAEGVRAAMSDFQKIGAALSSPVGVAVTSSPSGGAPATPQAPAAAPPL
jgi:DNA repair exonuclease SbcCD ATPase subunit